MTAPVRIRLSRQEGWRMPENTVNVARGPGRKWGNPWARGMFVRDAEAVMKYPAIAEIRAELAGKNLACWCPLDGPCHADTLLRVANGGEI